MKHEVVYSNDLVALIANYATVETLVIGFMVFWVGKLFA
jgi:hypothetical protein